MTENSTDDSQLTALAMKRGLTLFDEIRNLDPEMQAQTITIFLHVVTKPGIAMRELEKLTGLPSSSISRNVAAMTKTHRRGRLGLDILISKESPEDRRSKLVFMTPKGRRIAKRLVEILGG
jgi:DNA-binding MarR family transcriptional regulator